MNNRKLPAKCVMAVGGNNRNWVQQREEFSKDFASLDAYIDDAIQSSIPQGDPLYAAVKSIDLEFNDGPDDQAGTIQKLIAGIHQYPGNGMQMSNDDPWIRRVRSRKSDIFISGRDQYWLYLTRFIGAVLLC